MMTDPEKQRFFEDLLRDKLNGTYDGPTYRERALALAAGSEKEGLRMMLNTMRVLRGAEPVDEPENAKD